MSNSSPIMVTQAAAKHFQSVLAKKAQAKGIRVYVKKSGCSGYSYVIEVVDTAFTPDKNDLQIINNAVTVFVDHGSIEFLSGTTIDVVEKGLGQKQVIFDNPNVADACGCGESFTVKKEDEGE